MTLRPSSVIHNVQALRAFSSLIVIFVHLGVVLSAANYRAFGWGGVDIFFVISGFIIVYTTSGKAISPGGFLALRISRVLPLYWVVTAVVFVLTFITPSLFQATKGSMPQFLMSLAFIPFQKADHSVAPMLFVGWSLNYEVFFYLLFAVGLVFKSRLLGVGLTVSTILLLVLAGITFHISSIIAAFYTGLIMVDFVLGMVVGLLVSHFEPWLTRARVGAPTKAALTAVVILTLAFITFRPAMHEGWTRLTTAGLPALFAVGSVIALEKWGWALESKTIGLLGNASFSTYLISPFITQIAEKLVLRLNIEGLAVWGLILVTMLGVCGAGVLVHLIVERPLSRLAKHVLGVRGRLVPPLVSLCIEER